MRKIARARSNFAHLSKIQLYVDVYEIMEDTNQDYSRLKHILESSYHIKTQYIEILRQAIKYFMSIENQNNFTMLKGKPFEK